MLWKLPEPFSDSEIRDARDDSKDVWTLANNVLYNFCRDYPEHDDIKVVVAKVMLIGNVYGKVIRGYSLSVLKTNLENYYKKLAAEIMNLDLDAELRDMRSTE